MDSPAERIRTIEPIPYAPAPADAAEYNRWVAATLDLAKRALLDAGFDEVFLIPVEIKDAGFDRAELKMLGQVLLIDGTGADRSESSAFIQLTANGQLRLSTRPSGF